MTALIAGAGLAASWMGSQSAARGALQTGIANSQAAQYQAAVARNNAQIEEYNKQAMQYDVGVAETNIGIAQQKRDIAAENVDYQRKVGEQEIGSQILKTEAVAGTQRADLAAQGTDITSGTPLKVLQSTADLANMDAAIIRSNAMRKVYGAQLDVTAADVGIQAAKVAKYGAERDVYSAETKKESYQAQAGLYDLQAINAMRAGQINRKTAILGGISSVADKWMALQKSFSPPNLGLGE